MSKEAMKLALEALKLHEAAHECMVNDAIKALEEALKQEQGEPVAWIYKSEPYFDGDKWCEKYELTDSKKLAFWKDKDAKPLYTTPYVQEGWQQRTAAEGEDTHKAWVGLTDEEKLHIEIMGGKSDVMLAEMLEAKLKEKNT